MPSEFCGTQTVTLWAGQNINAGSVTVANDEANLYVTYTTTGGWLLTETHLAVAALFSGIPQTKDGNPIPGHFPYAQIHKPSVTTYTYTIQLGPNAWTPGTVLYIAAHAAVILPGGNGNGDQEETAWGDGTDFPGKTGQPTSPTP